jgi:hypothetical protein
MIISHKYKFIFVKTRKTAGTSLEIALSKICGPEDVITPTIYGPDDILRKEMGGRQPQNTAIPYREYSRKDWYHLVFKGKRTFFMEHMPAQQVVMRLGDSVWNDYYKFTIERNPFDKAVSLYYWRTRDLDNIPECIDFLKDRKLAFGLSNYPLYADDFGVQVDHVMRYENLQEELSSLEKRLMLDTQIEMPNAKGGIRKDRRPSSEVLGKDGIRFVKQACAREIELLSYESIS